VVPVDELLNERGLADPAAPADDEAFSRSCRADLFLDLTENLAQGGQFSTSPYEA
jgi:hypothetical protein